MIPSIQISELLTYNNPVIIDIRSNQSYNNNHIDGSINIPYQELITNPIKYLNRNTRYFIYCQKGITSKRICSILYNQGYNVVNIIGGYEEWVMKK